MAHFATDSIARLCYAPGGSMVAKLKFGFALLDLMLRLGSRWICRELYLFLKKIAIAMFARGDNGCLEGEGGKSENTHQPRAKTNRNHGPPLHGRSVWWEWIEGLLIASWSLVDFEGILESLEKDRNLELFRVYIPFRELWRKSIFRVYVWGKKWENFHLWFLKYGTWGRKNSEKNTFGVEYFSYDGWWPVNGWSTDSRLKQAVPSNKPCCSWPRLVNSHWFAASMHRIRKSRFLHGISEVKLI